MTEGIYGALAAPFDKTFTRVQAGISLSYLTGEQVMRRLNEVVGPFGWSFSVDEHGINAEADEAWVLGTLTIRVDGEGERAWRQQFGSQKIKRRTSDSSVLDIGFDLKGATTDCLKKCAAAFGVGLYLSEREPQDAPRPQPIPQTPYRSSPPPAVSEPTMRTSPQIPPKTLPKCSECGKTGVALRGMQGKLLCSDCSGLTSA